MIYIKIPINNVKEGKQNADNIFGSMLWDNRIKESLKAYPYDTKNPVIIETDANEKN